MSWSAARYGKRQTQFQNRRPSTTTIHRGRAARMRADDQQMVTRLAMEMNEVVKEGVLESIFGSPSAAYALNVALRIKRAKGREVRPSKEGSTPKDKANAHRGRRRRFRGRNVHHMTPKSRKGELFSGNTMRNLLLIKVTRHDLLHKEFGVRTWEEIIVLLSRCVRITWCAEFGNMVDSIAPAPVRKRMCRRMIRRSLNNLQLFGESPG